MLRNQFKAKQISSLQSKNQGFSLMEVLISMVVIAIGLLGYMALQLTSINSNQDGMARSQATLVAQELASSLRANRDYIFDEGGDSEYLIADNYIDCTTKPACLVDTNCTTAEQAKIDTWQACQTIQGFTAGTTTVSDDLLQNGQIRVGCTDRAADTDDCSPGSTLTIYTYWAVAAKREDTGQRSIALNQRCDAFQKVAENKITLADIGSEVDCQVLDLMP